MASTATTNGLGIAAKALEVKKLVETKPYVWGGKGLSGFDCSGYVAYVLTELFPHYAGQLRTNVHGFTQSSLFEKVSSPLEGDLVVFPTTGKQTEPNHIGIVTGKTEWTGAQSKGVRSVQFTDPYWSKRPQYYLRLREVSKQAISSYLQGMRDGLFA